MKVKGAEKVSLVLNMLSLAEIIFRRVAMEQAHFLFWLNSHTCCGIDQPLCGSSGSHLLHVHV